MSNAIIDKIPPHNVEAEKFVLGACLTTKDAVDVVSDIITNDMFYNEPHNFIFKTILSMRLSSQPIDLVTVAKELNKQGLIDRIGGLPYLASLTHTIANPDHAERHAKIIAEEYINRKLIEVGADIHVSGYDNTKDPFEALDEAQRKLNEVTNIHAGNDFNSLMNVNIELLEKIDKLRSNPNKVSGVRSGFVDIDRVTNGWQPTDLIIIAARPSVGKSTFSLNLALNAATHPENPIPIGFFSLEMGRVQLAERIMSAKTGILMDKIQRGQLEDYEYKELYESGISKLEQANIYIDDTAMLNIMQFKSKARKLVSKHGVGLIIIDYLQLMSGIKDKNGNREQEIASISRNLKATAKELNIPIIALSQLSRSVEQRAGSKKPMLSDLRECLAIEEWVYTPNGPIKIGKEPTSITTLSDIGIVNSPCEFIEKKYNTVYKLRTQYGQVRATANHLILTGTGWKKLRDLDIDRDVIASAKRISHANTGYIPHGRLLGWMLGNGGLSGTPALIYRKELDEEVRREVAKFGVQVKYRETQKSVNVYDTYLSNGVQSGSTLNPLMKWIRELGIEGLTCYNKYIPEIYLGSSNETHIELLKGLWESDGTVTNGRAKYATASETLAKQIGWLLLTIGVRCTIKKYENIWEVQCSSADNNEMLKIVDNPERFGPLKEPDEDYVDPAPAIFVELVAEMIRNKNVRLQKKITGGYKAVSKSRMLSILQHQNIETIQQSPYMTLPDVGWGRIISIEKEDQEVRVCDLSVPFTHNFISNGIIVHNSGTLEQDADLVMFLSRPEYYGNTTNEQGESTNGLTEVDIAKHRNGALDTIQLKAMLHIQKFVEWDGGEIRGSEGRVYVPVTQAKAFDDMPF